MMNKLNDIEKKNPYKVPENYFEEVNRKIIDNISDIPLHAEKRGIYIKIKPYLMIAASVTILSVLTYAGFRISDRNHKEIDISEIDFSNFPEYYFSEIDISSLEESAGPDILSGGISDVNSSEIIDYLLLENIDINEIYEIL